jgi:hypothetical protein
MTEVLAEGGAPEGCEWRLLSSKQQLQHGCRGATAGVTGPGGLVGDTPYRFSPLWLSKTCEQGGVEAYQLVGMWCVLRMLISDTKADRR